MGKIVEQTRFFSLDKVTGQGRQKTKFKNQKQESPKQSNMFNLVVATPAVWAIYSFARICAEIQVQIGILKRHTNVITYNQGVMNRRHYEEKPYLGFIQHTKMLVNRNYL